MYQFGKFCTHIFGCYVFFKQIFMYSLTFLLPYDKLFLHIGTFIIQIDVHNLVAIFSYLFLF